MIFEISYDDGTVKSFLKSIEYYNHISSELALSFEADFWKTINLLKIDPYIYQERYRGVRIVHLYKFPFGIHFIIEEQTVRVYKILHHKQSYN